MPEDASIEDFLGESDESDPKPPESETDGEDPPAVTYRHDPDGAACEDCGETVTERWHDDGAFVCAACKEW